MNLRFYGIAAVAALTTGYSTAQCPNTKAQTIAASTVLTGQQSCGITNLDIGNVQIATKQNRCPLFAVDTPAHEIVVAASSPANTKTMVSAIVSEWTYFFKCKQVWYVVVPWGSTCVVDRTILRNTLHRRVTISCSGPSQ